MSVDLRDYESSVRIRPLRLADFAEIAALQLRCFPTMAPWTLDQFTSQLKNFAEGQVCIEVDGKIAATSAALIVEYSDYAEWHDWHGVADEGFIRNHDPEGDTLYGIEIQVDPQYRGMKLARRLYDARKDTCRKQNLARMIVGGRIPSYSIYKDKLTPQEYIHEVIHKRIVDPVLTTQLANGFFVREVIPDYLPSDEDSAGYATCLEWSNLDYIPPRSTRSRHAIAPMRVATVQWGMHQISSFEEFAHQCEFFVDTASDHKADFVLFPELFTLQLLSIVKNVAPGSAARELASYTPKYLELFGDLAVRYNINTIAGSQFTEDDGRLFNVSYLFRRDGTIGMQRKIHVTPNEQRWWGVEGGDSFDVFETDCGKIALLVCYDIEFPELCRVAVDRGARVLFVPYNTTDRYGHLRVQTCARARCIENQVYVVTSGCVGNLPFVENADIHYAQSGIFTPSDLAFPRDGIAAEASPNVEMLVVQDLDTHALRRARRTGTVKNWNDRRLDLYEVVWKPDSH